MAAKGRSKSAASEDLLRNVENKEVLQIISQPDFIAPEGVDASAWISAVEAVREAVGKLNLDLEIAGEKSYMPAMCKEVDRQVRENDEIPDELLVDPTIKRVREEIALRLNIRIRLGRTEGLKALIALIKKKDGKIHSEDWSDFTTPTGKAKNRCYAIASAFGDTAARRKLAWDLIAKFLSELSGKAVEFVDQEYRGARRSPGAAGADEGPAEQKRRKFVLPEGLSLDSVDETGRAMFKGLRGLRAGAIELSATIQLQIDEIAAQLRTLDAEKIGIERELAETQRDLEPYQVEADKVEAKYARILSALQTIHKDLKELPKEHQRKKDEELQRLGEPYKNTLDKQNKLKSDREPIAAKVELLESEKARLTELKKKAELMLRGFETLQLFTVPTEGVQSRDGGDGDGDGDGAESADGLGDSDSDSDGGSDDDDEPAENPALKPTRDLAQWLRRLHDSIKTWPAYNGWKVVREAGRVDDLIAQLERLLEKKNLILQLITDSRFNGMLDTFLLDLQGIDPRGDNAPKGSRKKEKGSIKVERLGTLMGLLRDYEEEAA